MAAFVTGIILFIAGVVVGAVLFYRFGRKAGMKIASQLADMKQAENDLKHAAADLKKG